MADGKTKAEITADQREAIALREIREAIRNVRYGTVTVLVQDGIVIQIDRTEKIRLDYSRDSINGEGDGI